MLPDEECERRDGIIVLLVNVFAKYFISLTFCDKYCHHLDYRISSSLSLPLFSCPSVRLPVYMYVSLCLSMYPSIRQSVYLSVCLSLALSLFVVIHVVILKSKAPFKNQA